MRNAYSNLMGEFIDASQVEHADTAPFQIVCPCCAESVFKVARSHMEGKKSEFFSHRQADKALVAECERRVGSISETEIKSRNALGRGQTLKLFLSVIRDAVDLDWNEERFQCTSDLFHQKTTGLRGYPVVQEFLVNTHRSSFGSSWHQAATQDFLNSIKAGGGKLDTSFSEHFQVNIAMDVMKTLLTPQCSRSYGHLLRHAIGRAMNSNYVFGGVTVEGLAVIRPLLTAAARRTERETHVAMALLEHVPGGIVEGENLVSVIRSILEDEMMGTLLRLPYREMLENHKDKRPLLEGIVVRREAEAPDLGLSFVS